MKTYAIEQHPKIDALIQEIAIGEEIILTAHTKPVAKVIPFPSLTDNTKQFRKAGSLKGKIWMSPDFDEPLDEFKEYME
ncbi:MAG: DUF2281 domain-containing protein [Deltaproteobacteria bacterium]|nr:MAG: DUF2281 domain-containing protein [Deltaproteobacteria bacterium]